MLPRHCIHFHHLSLPSHSFNFPPVYWSLIYLCALIHFCCTCARHAISFVLIETFLPTELYSPTESYSPMELHLPMESCSPMESFLPCHVSLSYTYSLWSRLFGVYPFCCYLFLLYSSSHCPCCHLSLHHPSFSSFFRCPHPLVFVCIFILS